MQSVHVAIRAENLARSFGPVRAVEGVSFEVAEGGIFGFLGPNGAGKTTTINMLCTLLSPTSGRAFINGFDCVKEPDKVRRSIGLVFQDTTLDKDLTARENLLFHAYLYSIPRAETRRRVDEALVFAGLTDRADDLVKKFSGGMKRRLEVARGLIHRPKVLFLDEPTLGLDPQSRAALWEAITSLPAEHGVTVFMTTHYMEEAEVCDTIAIIDKGRLIAMDSPDALKKSLGGEVITLRTTDNQYAAEVVRNLTGYEAVERKGELVITGCAGEACIPEIIKALGERVISVRLERPTINDVFLSLTGKAIRDEDVDDADNIKGEVRAYRRRHGRG